MAPKRPTPLEKPPAVSSSEEEEEVELSSEEEEEEEGEEEEQQEEQKPHHKKAPSSSISPPAPAVNKKPATQPHSSSDEEEEEDDDEEGSESDSDHAPPSKGVAAVPSVKPIASKPMDVDGSKLLKKPIRSMPTSTAAATPTKSRSKRPVANSGGEVKESNRAQKKQKGAEAGGGDAAKTMEVEKKAKAAAGEGSKRASFQRVWSEEDEIAILEGMMDYAEKKRVHPATDLDGFYHFIKKTLHHDAARTQLLDKIRKLKKKYENNAAKAKNGEDPTFPKPHDKIIYDLSKKIWEAKGNASANNGGGGDQPKPNVKARKKSREPLSFAEKEELLASLRAPTPKDAPPPPSKEAEEPNAGHSDDLSSIMFSTGIVGGGVGLVESFVKDGLALLDSAKMSELEERWRKLREAEAETSLRRIELVHEQTKLILDAYKNQP